MLLRKKGYTVIVTSWENDADNYMTKERTFDTLDEACFVYDFCKKFTSPNGGFNPDKLGNTQLFRDGHMDMFNDAVIKHINDLFEKYDVPEEYHDEYYIDDCIISELIGYWSDGEMVRVVEKLKMTYQPDDIYVEQLREEIVR